MREHFLVEYCGLLFEFEGEWVEYIPGTFYARSGDPGDPPYGGYFEDYTIRLQDMDITEMCEGLAEINHVKASIYSGPRWDTGDTLADIIAMKAADMMGGRDAD